MKKVILGIALLSQFSYEVEGIPEFTEISKKANQSLVPLNFFDNSKAKFREQLKESAQRVADGFSELNTLSELDEEERESLKLQTVINEFGVLDDFCKKEFNQNRDKANEVFLHALAARTKDIMQNEIAQKEAEIVRLQGRLDELLKESPQTAESLNSFDKFIRRAEEDVRASKERTENFDVSKSELIGEKQINRTFARFSKKLENIQNEVQKGKDDLEKTLREVFEKTQEQYEDSTNTLIENLGDRYEDIMANVEERYKDQKKALAEAYDRQINIMNDKINEFTALNARLEKEKKLHGLISGVFMANKSLRAEKIMIRSGDINRMTDIFRKHNAVQNEYSKLAPFSGLYGREDLEVKAKQSDLTKLSEYVSNTKISPKPATPTLIRDVHNGPKWWNKYVSFSDMTFLMGKYGMLDIAWNYPGTDWGEVHTSWAYGPESENLRMFNYYKDTENSERNRIYNNELSRHNQEYGRALRQVFPSEEFDRLIEQFNTFVSKL